MSTTTVRKGSGRAAATERTNRHAQRTALPPKPGVVEAAREPIAKAPRKRAAKAPSEPVAAPEAPAPTDTHTKAHKHATAFSEAGWKTEVQTSGDYAELVAVRGTETIHQAWISGVYQPDAASYTIGDRTVKTRNVAEAIRWGKRSVADAEAEFAKVGANKSFVKRAPAEAPKAARLPFDLATVAEPELVNALAGAKIRWMNRLSNEEETGVVYPDVRRIHVKEQHGHRVVLFLCMNVGYRAFRLDSLLSVGKVSNNVLADMATRERNARNRSLGRKTKVAPEIAEAA